MMRLNLTDRQHELLLLSVEAQIEAATDDLSTMDNEGEMQEAQVELDELTQLFDLLSNKQPE